MNTLKLQYKKMDMEKVMILTGMILMETSGAILFFCGLLDIKIF